MLLCVGVSVQEGTCKQAWDAHISTLLHVYVLAVRFYYYFSHFIYFPLATTNKTTTNSSIQPTPSTSTIQAQSSLVKNASIIVITVPVSSSSFSSVTHFTETSVSHTASAQGN